MFLFFKTDTPESPSKPTISDVTARSMTLSWTPPEEDGGAKIKSYIIEKKEPFSSKWTAVGSTDDTSFTVTGLKEGTEYEFRVAAENKAGMGKFSPATPPTIAKEPYGNHYYSGNSFEKGVLMFIRCDLFLYTLINRKKL